MNPIQDSPANNNDDIARLERALLAAGKYIRPSDDLRPRTIEAAKEHCSNYRLVRNMMGLALAALLLMMLSVPVVETIRERRARATSPTSAEIQQQAIEYSVQAGVTPDWGLSQKFDDLRHFQADRLGR
jgi:hypothetical protein